MDRDILHSTVTGYVLLQNGALEQVCSSTVHTQEELEAVIAEYELPIEVGFDEHGGVVQSNEKEILEEELGVELESNMVSTRQFPNGCDAVDVIHYEVVKGHDLLRMEEEF